MSRTKPSVSPHLRRTTAHRPPACTMPQPAPGTPIPRVHRLLTPVKQLPALRLLKRGNEVRALIAFVANPAVGGRKDICGLRLGEGCHNASGFKAKRLG